ncbi:glycosyltransferase [Algoriphagus sp.]|uniref:glycosyltransferase n=1 Tax=Algoriphagus sp. TaxID=1872435 RepID=UPI002614D392|nr:glycosyltransferase [Algoriphagus sp.]
MKLAFLIHKAQPRGQEVFAAQLGNQLLQMGHEVILISLYEGNFDLGFNGSFISFNFPSSMALWLPSSWKKLDRFIQGMQVDIIQANGGDTLKYLALSRIMYPLSGRLIFNNGGVVGYYLTTFLKRSLYRFFLMKFDAAISVSRHAQLDLSQWLPASCLQFQIPIGIPPHQTFNLSNGPNHQVFVHIGGFSPEKNHKELVEIFIKHLKNHHEHQLWMIGEGPSRMEIEGMIQEPYTQSFRFLGSVKDPWVYVPQNAILLLTSRMEGMPAVIAEAMMAKIPVISYAIGGVAEMAQELGTISLIDFGDQRSFLKAMKFWSTMGRDSIQGQLQESYDSAIKRFDLKTISNRFLDVYQKVCG